MKGISNNRIKGNITGVTKGTIITIDMIISKIKSKIKIVGVSSKYKEVQINQEPQGMVVHLCVSGVVRLGTPLKIADAGLKHVSYAIRKAIGKGNAGIAVLTIDRIVTRGIIKTTEINRILEIHTPDKLQTLGQATETK